MDARIASNLLLVLRPEIERAQVLLEGAQALQAIAAAGQPVQAPAATEHPVATLPAPGDTPAVPTGPVHFTDDSAAV